MISARPIHFLTRMGLSKNKNFQILVFKKVYNNINKPSQKSKENFQKYLGNFAGKEVKGTLPDSQSPEFSMAIIIPEPAILLFSRRKRNTMRNSLISKRKPFSTTCFSPTSSFSKNSILIRRLDSLE